MISLDETLESARRDANLEANKNPFIGPDQRDDRPSTANEIQYGGGHYKKLKIQHWDYVDANNIPYLEACAIKYLTRWRDKGGVEDLRKAIHFIEKRIELEEAKEKK